MVLFPKARTYTPRVRLTVGTTKTPSFAAVPEIKRAPSAVYNFTGAAGARLESVISLSPYVRTEEGVAGTLITESISLPSCVEKFHERTSELGKLSSPLGWTKTRLPSERRALKPEFMSIRTELLSLSRTSTLWKSCALALIPRARIAIRRNICFFNCGNVLALKNKVTNFPLIPPPRFC